MREGATACDGERDGEDAGGTPGGADETDADDDTAEQEAENAEVSRSCSATSPNKADLPASLHAGDQR